MPLARAIAFAATMPIWLTSARTVSQVMDELSPVGAVGIREHWARSSNENQHQQRSLHQPSFRTHTRSRKLGPPARLDIGRAAVIPVAGAFMEDRIETCPHACRAAARVMTSCNDPPQQVLRTAGVPILLILL